MEKDEFLIKMGEFVSNAEKEISEINEDAKKVVETHLKLCDFYGVDAKDEMREKSENFFKVFQEFFKLTEKSLPPEEKKKPAPGSKGPAGRAGPGAANNAAMMAELMKKQAEKGPIKEIAH